LHSKVSRQTGLILSHCLACALMLKCWFLRAGSYGGPRRGGGSYY